jgi:hypothetical protein
MIKIIIHDREDLELLIDVIREVVLVNDLVGSRQTTLHDHEGC